MAKSNGSATGSEGVLPQSLADELIGVEKYPRPKTPATFPSPGDSVDVALYSVDGRQDFVFDVSAHDFSDRSAKYQTRWRTRTVLVRLCVDRHRHRNPDRTRVGRTHLHVYREGYDDRYATDQIGDTFHDLDDVSATLFDFYKFCNIKGTPIGTRKMLSD